MRRGIRYKYHKEAIAIMRELNRQLKADSRINGRFMVMSKTEQFELFEDGSGGLLYILVRCYDRAHDEYKDYWWEFAPYINTCEWDLCMQILNDFACKQMLEHRDTKIIFDFKNKKLDISEVNSRPIKIWIWR